MPREMQLQGQIAAIRTRGTLRHVMAGGTGQLGPEMGYEMEERLIRALRGQQLQPKAQDETAAPSGETLMPAIEDLKEELSAEAQRVFGSSDITRVRNQVSAWLACVALITATATVVKEFGSIAQGLREMSRLVPDRLRIFLGRAMARTFGSAADMHLNEDPSIEMRGALLSATELERGTTPVAGQEAQPSAAAPGRQAETESSSSGAAASSPSTASAPVARRGPPRADTRLITYLLVSHALLTVTLIAAAVVLLITLP